MRLRRARRLPPFVRAVQARRRAATRSLSRLALLATSFLLSAVTVVPLIAQESQALDPVVLEGVQSGTATLSPGSSSVSVPITAVDPAKAFLVFGVEEDSNYPGNSEVSGRLSGGNAVVFERTETGDTVAIRWQVAEFQSGVRVQRGTRGDGCADRDRADRRGGRRSQLSAGDRAQQRGGVGGRGLHPGPSHRVDEPGVGDQQRLLHALRGVAGRRVLRSLRAAR